MLSRKFAVACIALTCTLTSGLSADVVVSTDFEGTTENGTTLEDVVYTTVFAGLVVAPVDTNLVVNNTIQSAGTGNLFTTGAADGAFAVANNTGNGGEWEFEFDFTTGADAIDLDDLSFEWRNFGGNGGNQFALRNTTVVFDLIDTSAMSSVVGGPLSWVTPTVNTGNGTGSTIGMAGPQPGQFALTGSSLAANTTYTIVLGAADATTGGNNFGFDSIALNGTAVAVPEPSSALAVVGLGFVCGLRRRR